MMEVVGICGVPYIEGDYAVAWDTTSLTSEPSYAEIFDHLQDLVSVFDDFALTSLYRKLTLAY